MATWPTTLPVPLRDNATCTIGNNVLYRKMESGRREVRRYGSAAPDKWTLTLRLKKDQIDLFNTFFRVNLNLGTNWFTADWITTRLGYPDHKGKFASYPTLQTDAGSYQDVTIDILIKKSAACAADTAWPPEGW